MGASIRRQISISLLIVVTGGCSSQPLFEARTVVHSDGSCERTIWQPEGEMLPAEALQPPWKARWKTVAAANIPPAFAKDHQADGSHKYFMAQGSFRTPGEIPAHFRNVADPSVPVGASELVRSYEREDFGFVVEHRWRETLTNIVTHEGFLKARDEFLERGIPRAIEGLEQVYGKRYDVSALAQYLRGDGRRFLEESALAFYDLCARHRPAEEHAAAYAAVATRFGLDLLDPAGKVVEGEESATRLKTYFRHRIALGLRHRDGSPLARTEIDEILGTSGGSPFAREWEVYWKEHEKSLAAELGPALLRMTGLYNVPFLMFGPGATPQFAFELFLPGRIVETSGTLIGPGRAAWRFSGVETFPDGFVMTARSLEIDFVDQTRLLGRVSIDDLEKAEAYLAAIGRDGPLLKEVRRAHEAGDLKGLEEFVPKTAEEKRRLAQLCSMLGLEK